MGLWLERCISLPTSRKLSLKPQTSLFYLFLGRICVAVAGEFVCAAVSGTVCVDVAGKILCAAVAGDAVRVAVARR